MNLKEIKKNARKALKGNWGLAIGTWLLMYAIMYPIIWFVTPIFGFAIGGWLENTLDMMVAFMVTPILSTGVAWISLSFVDFKETTIGEMFKPFKNYGRILGAMMIVILLMSLWGVLFGFVGGFIFTAITPEVSYDFNLAATIIRILVIVLIVVLALILISFRYAMVPYLLKDFPGFSATNAVKASKVIMKGKTFKFFQLRFFFFLIVAPGIVSLFVGFGMIVYLIIQLIFDNPMLALFPHMIEAQIYLGSSLLFDMLAGMLLIMFGGLYWFGMNFYVVPYRNASIAAFYRELVAKVEKQVVTSEDVANDSDYSDFLSNTPPKEIDGTEFDEEIPTL